MKDAFDLLKALPVGKLSEEQLKELNAALAALNAARSSSPEANGDVTRVATEYLYRLEQDAARYRWLRDAKSHEAPVGSLVELWLFSRPTASAVGIDAAIDAALSRSEGKT